MSEKPASWYSISPAGTLAIGNLTPVGQNSGQVDCRWPPNGHQLAACLDLPSDCQLWGPFWHFREKSFEKEIYVTLPLPVYRLESPEEIPTEIFRMVWRDDRWQVQPQHQKASIEVVGGGYLISGTTLKDLWREGKFKNDFKQENDSQLQKPPWKKLTLSHNSREDFQVKDKGGFFAERTVLMAPGWSILVKIIGEYNLLERLPQAPWSFLGAGATPVSIKREDKINACWLKGKQESFQGTGAVLLVGALWHQNSLSVPCPQVPIKAYAAEVGIPWQSWKRAKTHLIVQDPPRVKTHPTISLTPGEWMTPAGAVYLWEGEAPLATSEPLPDKYHRHAIGYGHLWLFEEKQNNGN